MRYDARMQKFAILIDYENFPCPPDGLKRLLADFSQRGALAVKRAYADWVRLSGYRQFLLANQIEMIELPCASRGKNSADIRLVVDAMELVFTKPHISTFVIASADADFLPLLSRLREYNKHTIVVARTRDLHTYMRTHCDEFINGDVYLSKACGKASSNPIPSRAQPKIQSPTSEQVRQIQELMLDAWQSHGVERPLDLAGLGSQLKRSKPGLDWKDYGFKALQPLVAYLVTNGFLRIELTNGSRNRIYLAQSSNSLPGPAKTEAATFDVGSNIMRTPDVAVQEAELVSLMKEISHAPMRWDVLRERLRQIRPSLLRDNQSEDAFLKVLQSSEARGEIDMQYDSIQKTYFVSLMPTDRSMPSPQGDTEANTEDNAPVWTQPELF